MQTEDIWSVAQPEAVKTLKVRVKDRHVPVLRHMAFEVNQVWNACNAHQRRYTGARDEAVGLYLVEPTGRWRLVDPEAGQPVCVCPFCWPAAERALGRGGRLIVRQLALRPSWARCGVCDPDDPC